MARSHPVSHIDIESNDLQLMPVPVCTQRTPLSDTNGGVGRIEELLLQDGSSH